MKTLMLISLMLLVSCGKDAKNYRSQGQQDKKGIPFIAVTEGSISDAGSTVVNEGSPNSISPESNTAATEVAAPGIEKKYICNFSGPSESVNFIMKVKGTDKRNAILSNPTPGGKLSLEGYNLSPSMNENATVTHEDKNLMIEGKKVQKITARIVMDENGLTGELQVSYRFKGEKGDESNTDFQKLANINNCTEN